MKHRIITISREFGSGGRTIGKQVAQALGIPCYDNELLTKLAKESGFEENYLEEVDEYAPGGFLSSAFSHLGSVPNNSDYLWKIQYRISPTWPSRGPASSWAAAPTTSCGTRRIACGCSSTRL